MDVTDSEEEREKLQMCVSEPTFDRVLQVYVVSSAAQPSSKSVLNSTHEQSKSRLPDAWTSHEFEILIVDVERPKPHPIGLSTEP